MAFPNDRGCQLEREMQDVMGRIGYLESLVDKIIDVLETSQFDEVMDYKTELSDE